MTSKTSTTASDVDRQAVLDVLKRGYEAWEANDAEAFVADYLDDASVVQPGIYKKDREEIRTTMAAGFAGPLQGSRVVDHPQDVRFLTDDTAIVVSEGGIAFPRTGRRPERGVGARYLGARQAGRELVRRRIPQQPCELGRRRSGTAAPAFVGEPLVPGSPEGH